MKLGRMFRIVGLFVPIVVVSAVDAQSVGSPQWVAATVSALNTGTAAAQQAARLQLIEAGQMKGSPASYPATLATALLPVLRSGGPRAKLNAAVAIERVADKTASPSLVPAVSVLLDDSSDAIALWGVKAARPLIAAGGAAAPKLAARIAATVKAHPDSGPIAEEAYAALLTDPVQPPLVDPLLAVLQARTAAYGTGTPPPSPLAERSVLAYLSATYWPKASPAQQKRILTDLANLACAAAGLLVNGNNDRALLVLTRSTAGALGAIATQSANPALTAAADSLRNVRAGDDPALPAALKALKAAVAPLGIALQPPLPPATSSNQ